MKLRWNREFIPSFLLNAGPGDSPGGGSAPSGGGGSSSASAPSAAPSSGSAPTSPSSPSAPSAPSSPSSASPSSTSPPASPDGAVTSQPGGDALDFEAIFAGPIDASPASAPIPPAPAPVPPVAPPAVAPAAAPVAQPAVPASEPVAPPAPTPATSTAGASPPALDPSDPASIASHLMLNRDAAIAHIAETRFKLSPEDVEALESDTVGTVPKLLARTFVELQSTMLNQMARLVPQMVQRQTEAVKKNTEAENAFYSMWPTIDRSKHGDLVKRYAITYRQMHPEATREQMFADVGPLVMMAAKIPLAAPQAPGGNPAQPQIPSPKPVPFVPAGGAAPGGPNNSVELNPVEAMFVDR